MCIRDRVKKLGQPGALSAASAGLFVRDWVAGATGIRYFSSGSPKWQDRAALMAVSYTHLDVYKRQPPAHVEIGARRWALATAALGVYILLAEIDRLVGMIPDLSLIHI